MDTKTLIEEYLSRAGEPSPISPLVVELDKFRIMSDQVENTDAFSVEQTLTRKYRIPEKLFYNIDENGLPKVRKSLTISLAKATVSIRPISLRLTRLRRKRQRRLTRNISFTMTLMPVVHGNGTSVCFSAMPCPACPQWDRKHYRIW